MSNTQRQTQHAHHITWNSQHPSEWYDDSGHRPTCIYNGLRVLVRIDRWYTEGDDMNPAPWTNVRSDYAEGIIDHDGNIRCYDFAHGCDEPYLIITKEPHFVKLNDDGMRFEDEPMYMQWSASDYIMEYVDTTHNDKVRAPAGEAHQCYWVLLESPRY